MKTEVKIPEIETARLRLRPFSMADVPQVATLANEWDIANNTAALPYPYTLEMAESWIRSHTGHSDPDHEITFAIANNTDNSVIGAIGIRPLWAHARGEFGYWIGKPFWNRGYATEAGKALITYAFDVLHLNKVHAVHFVRNPASGRVMQKIGMQHEGTLRAHIKRWDKYEDCEAYGVLRSDWLD